MDFTGDIEELAKVSLRLHFKIPPQENLPAYVMRQDQRVNESKSRKALQTGLPTSK